MSLASGPTQNYDMESEHTWLARPKLAFLVRGIVWLIPVLSSFAVIWSAARWLSPHRIGIDMWLWWLVFLVVAWMVMSTVERMMRRFVPLVTLLQMSLVFPDVAPSRYKESLRSGTVKQLKERIETAGDSETERSDAYYSQLLLDMAKMIASHDRLTRGHSERVRAYTDMIAEEMGLPKEERDKLRWSALLHDIGKLSVPAEVLNKPSRPSKEEWALIQGHPEAAEDFLTPLSAWLDGWEAVAIEHHERWDGGGYPYGKQGTGIHLGSRIVAVADAYDVMTSTRSYKTPMDPALAREEIARNAGTQFDPAVVRAFLTLSVGNMNTKFGALSWFANIPAAFGAAAAPIIPAVAAPLAITATTAASVAVVAVGGATGAIAPEPMDAPPEELAFVIADGIPLTEVVTVPTRVGDLQAQFEISDASDVLEASRSNIEEELNAVATIEFVEGQENVPPAVVVTITPTPQPQPPGSLASLPTGASAAPAPTDVPKATPKPSATPVPSATSVPPKVPKATPVPEPTKVPKATPVPEPTKIPKATPVPKPTKVPKTTPIPEPTATAPPEPTATPVPSPPIEPVQFFFTSEGPQDQEASKFLPLTTSAPANPVLVNLDTNQDDDPGRLLKDGGKGPHEGNKSKAIHWLSTLDSGLEFTGTASVQLYVALEDFETEAGAVLHAFLSVCTPDELRKCDVLAAGSWSQPNFTDQGWTLAAFGVAGEPTTLAPGTVLKVTVTNDDDSDEDLWVAFDATSYPSSIVIN